MLKTIFSNDTLIRFTKTTYFKVILLGAGNIVNAGMGFLFILACARSLDVTSFGKYVLLAGILISVAKLSDFGTNSLFVAHSIKNAKNSGDDDLTDFVNSKIFLLLVSALASVIALIYFKLAQPEIFFIMLLGVFGYSLYYLLYGIFHRSERFLMLLMLNFIPGILKGVFGLLILQKVINLEAEGYFSLFVTALFSILILVPFANLSKLKIKVSVDYFLRKLKTVYQAGISQFINESWPSINSGLIKSFLTFSSVAVYSLADKMSDVFSLLSLAIFTVLLPKNARNKKSNTKYNFLEILMLSVSIIVLAVICYLGSVFVITNYLDLEYQKSIGLLGILIFNSALVAISAFMEHHFYIEEKPSYLLITNVTRLSILIILATILLPTFGILGLSLANIVSTVTGLCIILYFVKKINVY